MKWLGLSKSKVLKTPEDVMEHSYGVKPEEISVDVSFDEPEPEPEPEEEPEPEPEEEPEGDVAPEYTSGSDSGLEAEDYAEYLVSTFKKDDLVAIATKLGLETDGNKADIAVRITASEFASE